MSKDAETEHRPGLIPAGYSERFVRFFGWWTRGRMLAKRFHAVRLARDNHEALDEIHRLAGPVIALTNHASWWDPLVMLYLHRRFMPERTLRAPMDAAQLERFRFFKRLGCFGIDPDDSAGLGAMGRYVGAYFDAEPLPTLWITPQGRFADVREPAPPRPGAAALAARHAGARVVSVSIEYAFWLDPKPEIFIRFQPVHAERTSTAGWQRAIRDAMQTGATALAERVIARDPAGFTDLIGGRSSSGNPVYDLLLRLRGKAGQIDDRRNRAEAEA